MLTRPTCSSFGWDPEEKIVIVEKAVWDAYVQVLFLYYFELFMSESILVY